MRTLSSNSLASCLQIAATNILLSDLANRFDSNYFVGTDKGDKMLEIISNCSYQLSANIMDDAEVYKIVLAFFDKFAFTNDWMDRAEGLAKQYNVKTEAS